MAKKLVPTTTDFIFHGNTVRTVGADPDLWFVAKDVCEVFGIAWRGSDTLTAIPADWRGVRKLRTPQKNQYGQMGYVETEVIVLRAFAVYKLAFRSNKPFADEFTNWVASEVIPSIQKKGYYDATQRAKHLKAGKSEQWSEERIEGVERRKGYTDTLKAHGVNGPREYAACTDAINRPILGYPAATAKMVRQLPPKAVLRDHVSIGELIQLKYAESLASDRIDKDNLNGVAPCQHASRLAGEAVAQALRIALEGDISKPAEGQ